MRIFGFEQYGGPEVEGFFDVPDPAAAPGTVLISMGAAGVNPADIKVRGGARQGPVSVTFPMAMGREAAGTVIEDPSGTFESGQLVFGSCAASTGALGEKVLLDLAQTAVVPDGVALETAACIPVALGTAWDALGELEVDEGTTLLILGAGGGVGIHAIQLARHLGARVLGVASAGKRELVIGADAEHVTSGATWTERAAALAPGGVDAVLDTVGGPTLREAAALVGDASRIRSAADPALATELGGSGITRRRERGVFAEIADLVARGAVHPVISSVHPFAQAAEAVAEVETGHARGKSIVTP